MILVLVGNDRSYIESVSKILEITNGYEIKTEDELNFKNSKDKSILILNYSDLDGYRSRHSQSDSTDFVIEIRENRNKENKTHKHIDFVFTQRDIVDCVLFLNELHDEIQQTYEYYQELKDTHRVNNSPLRV